jgi:hypothetical protein
MGFIERERARIEVALREPQTPERYCQLYAAQQALAWATEPTGYASPYDTIQRGRVLPLRDILEGSEDCLAEARPPWSSGIHGLHARQL